MVGRIDALVGVGDNSLDTLRSLRKNEEELLEHSTRDFLASIVPQSGSASLSASVMSGAFVKSGSIESHQSDYAKARQAGLQALSKQATRQNAILAAGLAELATASGIGGRIAIGKRVKERILREKEQATVEASERNLDAIKDNIAQKAQEGIAPKDENGEPIAGLTSDPQMSASGTEKTRPSPSPESLAPTPEIALPEVETAAPVPATPSVDITV